MIPRIRLIITLLLGCHLFVAPSLVTSQLRSASSSLEPFPMAANAGVVDPKDQSLSPAQQAGPAKIVPSAPDDEGMKVMEEVIQQQLQSAAEQDSNPPPPPANVVLNKDDVLIRADEQEKNQDIYKVRGHVEI